MSASRAIQRQIKARTKLVDMILFGGLESPTSEHAGERAKLRAKLGRAKLEFRSSSERKVWQYLLDARRHYDEKRDGLSLWMSFVDNVNALRVDEMEFRFRALASLQVGMMSISGHAGDRGWWSADAASRGEVLTKMIQEV